MNKNKGYIFTPYNIMENTTILVDGNFNPTNKIVNRYYLLSNRRKKLNKMITKVKVYKAIKNYVGDNVVDDLSYALALNDLDAINNFITENDVEYKWKNELIKDKKQDALNYLRIFKVVKFKIKTQNKIINGR